MAQGRRGDRRDDSYSGETNPRSADAPQYHLSEDEHEQRLPQSTAPSTSQHLCYVPWNAPPPHPGVRETHYAVPCTNDSAPGNDAWRETRQIFRLVSIKEQGPPVELFHATEITGTPQNSQPNYTPVGGQGPTSAPNTHSGAGTNSQPHSAGNDALVPSESLRSLPRRLILDLGTNVSVLNVEASRSGRLSNRHTRDGGTSSEVVGGIAHESYEVILSTLRDSA
ncbi:hypothetical protein EI94DRAFT_1703800 [Lactarius quietus]|nr:hypothetical protein EI94DRAFT_1703800 [Lactarius quietus]